MEIPREVVRLAVVSSVPPLNEMFAELPKFSVALIESVPSLI
jgi:hypothetical protein